MDPNPLPLDDASCNSLQHGCLNKGSGSSRLQFQDKSLKITTRCAFAKMRESVAFWLKSPLLLKLEWARLWLAGKEFTCFHVWVSLELLAVGKKWVLSTFGSFHLVWLLTGKTLSCQLLNLWVGTHSLVWKKRLLSYCLHFVVSLWTIFDFWQGRRSPASYLTSFSLILVLIVHFLVISLR